MDLVSVFGREITIFPVTFVEEAVFSLLYIFGTFVKNKVGIAVWIHIRVLYSVPLVFISVFVSVSCCFYYYCFVIWLEVRYCDSNSIALFTEYCLGYSQSLAFPNEFRVDFSISVMNVIWILMGIALNM
jgi:hypothetical protein